jgi:hypothetical protein
MRHGNGVSGQPAASTSDNTRLPRRRCAPCHRGRGNRSRVKGGGHAFAALAVGSRHVGKRKTLAASGEQQIEDVVQFTMPGKSCRPLRASNVPQHVPHASDRVAQQDSQRALPRSEFNGRNLLCSNAVTTVPLR